MPKWFTTVPLRLTRWTGGWNIANSVGCSERPGVPSKEAWEAFEKLTIQGSARTNLFRYKDTLRELIAEAGRKPRRNDDPLLVQWKVELANADREWADLIEEDERHVIQFRAGGWTIMHPLSCRPNLFACRVNIAAEEQLVDPPARLGRFVCWEDEDGTFCWNSFCINEDCEDCVGE